MAKEVEVLRAKLHELIDALAAPQQTSMLLWASYFDARHLLRKLALLKYSDVVGHYVTSGQGLDFPSEGFKDVSDDASRHEELFAELHTPPRQ